MVKNKKVTLLFVLDENNDVNLHSWYVTKKRAIEESERLRNKGFFTQCHTIQKEENGFFINLEDMWFYKQNECKYSKKNNFFVKV